MTDAELRNAILMLRFIDEAPFMNELFHDGVDWDGPIPQKFWSDFRGDPVKFYTNASDAHRNALFAIIQKRLTVGDVND